MLGAQTRRGAARVPALAVIAAVMLGACEWVFPPFRLAEGDGGTGGDARSDGGGECVEGACTCISSSPCTRSCPGGGCRFVCAGSGSCSFACVGGDCTATGTSAGDIELSCAGGGCTTLCLGAGSCRITDCAGGGCRMQ